MTQADMPAAPAPSLTVLWWSGTDLFSRLVEEDTHSRFSHVAVEINGVLFEAVPPVVRRTTGAAYIASAVVSKTVPAPALTNGLAWATSMLGTPYSQMENVGFALGVDLARPNTLDCGVYVAGILVRAGCAVEIRDERAMKPDDVAHVLGVN